jgi:hypothetical protein
VPAVTEPGKIRNIAVVGHRGVGKTSLAEALLFQAGKTNRLGTIDAGTTAADWDDHEHKRQMSLSGALLHVDWQDRKINLVDCPGDPGFQAARTSAATAITQRAAPCAPTSAAIATPTSASARSKNRSESARRCTRAGYSRSPPAAPEAPRFPGRASSRSPSSSP